MSSGLMSELDAVNKILAATGDSPVATLDDSYSQSKIALQELRRATRNIQLQGWWFNEEQGVELQPNTAGFITLGTNVLQAFSKEGDGYIIQRGNSLYNRDKRTYKFDKPVSVDMILGLEWDELPEQARIYISDLAAVRFNNGFFGAQDVKQVLERNLQLSQVEMESADTEARDTNLLRNTRAHNIAFRHRRG